MQTNVVRVSDDSASDGRPSSLTTKLLITRRSLVADGALNPSYPNDGGDVLGGSGKQSMPISNMASFKNFIGGSSLIANLYWTGPAYII